MMTASNMSILREGTASAGSNACQQWRVDLDCGLMVRCGHRNHPDFADGVYRFWLPMPQVIAAEREMARRDGEGAQILHSLSPCSMTLAHTRPAGRWMTVLTGPSPRCSPMPMRSSVMPLTGGADGLVNGEAVVVNGAMARELVAVYCYPARPAIHDLGLVWEVLRAAIYGIDPKATGSKRTGDVSDPPPS